MFASGNQKNILESLQDARRHSHFETGAVSYKDRKMAI